jgi:glycerol-3-phosphate dehydrogenase
MTRDEIYDVVIVGGGINGATILHGLAAAGYRVLLIDRGDFGSGTSQASAMLVWGGLLYLRDLELLTVLRLSAARDALIRQQRTTVRPQTVRYITERGGRSRTFVQSMLYAYWALGGFRREHPRFDRRFSERALLDPDRVLGALTYEEARIAPSDARFVLSWILGAVSDRAVARNYCALAGGAFDPRSEKWRLELSGPAWAGEVEARLVVNAAGGWTEGVNAAFGRSSPWRHLLSRGVSISIPRDLRHEAIVACDAAPGGTAMSLVPWGPVSLWGSTDTIHASMPEAMAFTTDDVEGLLDLLNAHLARRVSMDDVVSVRCGVRALAVPAGFRPGGDLTRLSRHHRIHPDEGQPWISVYGGKLSGCVSIADAVRREVEARIGRVRLPLAAERGESPDPPTVSFPGLRERVAAPEWCVKHEWCRSLDDYLRRRTNIAQWVPRGGLGRQLEHLPHVRDIARAIHRGDQTRGDEDVARYVAAADRSWRVIQPQPGVTEERSLTCIH